MLKDMKLAEKIGGGFVLVLLLTVAIALLSVLCLWSLERTSVKNEMTGDILQTMQAGTIAGKNYVITKTDSYRAEVDGAMKKIIEEATSLRATERNPAYTAIYDRIIEGATVYRVNFGDLAKYEDRKTVTDAAMVEAADSFAQKRPSGLEKEAIKAVSGAADSLHRRRSQPWSRCLRPITPPTSPGPTT